MFGMGICQSLLRPVQYVQMKSLKLDHEQAQQLQSGAQATTWRLFDDKDLSVNDVVHLIDKVEPDRPETWKVIGTARITQIIEKRFDEIDDKDLLGHEQYEDRDDMLRRYQGFYGPHVGWSTTVKIVHFDFIDETSSDATKSGRGFDQDESGLARTKPTIDLDKAEATHHVSRPPRQLKIYTDGGSRGNPGPSASGFVIVDAATGTVLVDKGIYLGVTTNNQAEYLALKYALEEASRMGARELKVYMDSMLVVNQMRGIFKIKNRDLWPVHQMIKDSLEKFDKVSFDHIPREQNYLADAAVNRALDEQQDSFA